MKKTTIMYLVVICVCAGFGLCLFNSGMGRTVQSSTNETVASSGSVEATQAEPEKFENTSSATESDQPATDDNSASADETTAQSDTEQDQPATEEKSDDEWRTDMTGSESTVKMIDLEGEISLLEAQLKTSAPRLLRVKQLLQQAREDLKVARAAYVASDEDSADRLERMVKRAGCEFERACDIAEVKLSSFE
ncbi:MAG: hypothetical protein K2Z81_22505 [Cyanobacteria bacterium]|nr:hypothetical protein [Cyanobacteriota bacterium]